MDKKKALTWLFLSVFMGSTWADERASTPINVLKDGAYLFTSPLRINRDNLRVSLGLGVAIGGSLLLDRTVLDHLAPWSETASAKDWRTFGDYGQLSGPVIGTVFAIDGWATGNERSKETAALAYESFIWAGALEGTIKFAVGRARPSATDHPFVFNPGGTNGSFPSGHTTEAFAAATVFSEQYPRWEVYIPAYAAAAAVGFSRLYANQHWTSDVLAGAVLGVSVSHFLRKRFHDRSKQTTKFLWDGSSLRWVKLF
jgi:membrane-associated phospholipid phosphatase